MLFKSIIIAHPTINFWQKTLISNLPHVFQQYTFFLYKDEKTMIKNIYILHSILHMVNHASCWQLAYEVCCPLCMEENIYYNCNHHFDICEQLATWISKKHSVALFVLCFKLPATFINVVVFFFYPQISFISCHKKTRNIIHNLLPLGVFSILKQSLIITISMPLLPLCFKYLCSLNFILLPKGKVNKIFLNFSIHFYIFVQGLTLKTRSEHKVVYIFMIDTN